MHPHLQTITLPHEFFCEGCSRGLVLRNEDLGFADRHTAYGIEKLVEENGWTVEADGTAWCPSCASGGC